LEIILGQKILQILLNHLFVNTSGSQFCDIIPYFYRAVKTLVMSYVSCLLLIICVFY
jgi:hypothetical protein